MRQIILFTLLTLSVTTYGQSQKWKLSFQLKPEITFHKDSYRWWKEDSRKTTFNLGVASTVQYNINNHFFANAGIGYVFRTLQTANFLNQAALPPPKQSFTTELVTTKSVSYRVLSFPVSIGYNFLHKDKFNSFITAGFAGNYLLNTRYQSNFSKYDGTYKKNYWQGYSLILGLGADYKISKKISATSTLTYAVINKVKPDEYISNQNGNGLEMAHNFLSLNIGIKLPF
jgi:hypothetical protein